MNEKWKFEHRNLIEKRQLVQRRLTAPWRTVSVLGLLALLASGCATGLGPRALRSERPDYNQQILRSADAEMLLNLVRLRYNDSPLFLELGAVVAQYGYDASFNACGQVPGSGDGGATVGTGLGYGEHPTVTYTPLTGEEFATRMLTPIPLDSIMLFEQTGWSAERLLLVTVQRINDLFNAPTATGPTPERKPDYEAFADFAERFQRLRLAGLIGLNWEMKEHETDPPGRNPRFWLRPPADPNSPLAADVAAVRRFLGLGSPAQDDFELTAFPFERQPTEVGMRCRSLLGVLYFLSKSVEPPAPHVQTGPRHGHRGRRRTTVRLVEGHRQGHDHPLARGTSAERVRRRPASRLVVLHRRRRPELEGHLQPAEHPLLASSGDRQGQIAPPDAAGG